MPWNWRPYLWIIGVGLYGMPAAAKGEEGTDVWAWLDVTVWQEGDQRFHVFSHQAMADGRGAISQLVSPRFKYRAQPWLELGAGFSMLNLERRDSEESSYDQARPEMEVNPIWRLSEDWRLHFRNRVEVRWDEWGGEPRPRMRHRVQLTRDLDEWGPLVALYSSNEWLVELDRGDWTEDRWVPLGFSFEVTKGVVLDMFYMMRFFRGDDAWTDESVAGVFLKLSL
jgi:Protein of unknown function (DUF2490)